MAIAKRHVVAHGVLRKSRAVFPLATPAPLPFSALPHGFAIGPSPERTDQACDDDSDAHCGKAQSLAAMITAMITAANLGAKAKRSGQTCCTS
ncbi:hypothetical protein MGWOODY_Smn3376 [hydrothermal vent metagenome]|uniref:Uncharacterized protein n=1 Tax=hydrothermal vent metagenome TaxID=652676 RepID=A0A160TGX8_9ZZZZ